VYPRGENGVPRKGSLLQVVYDHGRVPLSATGSKSPAFASANATAEARGTLTMEGALHAWPKFSDIKERVRTEWEALPKVFDPISQELRDKIKVVLATKP